MNIVKKKENINYGGVDNVRKLEVFPIVLLNKQFVRLLKQIVPQDLISTYYFKILQINMLIHFVINKKKKFIDPALLN